MCELLHTSAVVQKMQRGQKNPWNVRGPGQARRLLRACELVTVGVGVLSNLFSFLLKEPSSVLKGGEQGCQRQFVNEVARASCYRVRSQFGPRGVRHLLSPASMPAFSVASRLSNSSVIDALLQLA